MKSATVENDGSRPLTKVVGNFRLPIASLFPSSIKMYKNSIKTILGYGYLQQV